MAAEAEVGVGVFGESLPEGVVGNVATVAVDTGAGVVGRVKGKHDTDGEERAEN
jgi:hypothetical protein